MKTPRALILGTLVLVAVVAGGCSIVGPTPIPPDVGVTSPPGGGGGGGGVAPGEPQPQFVVPKPGQLALHQVSIAKLVASVSGRAVTVQAEWYSGVEPCSVLDSVQVVRDGTTFTVALLEGTGDPNGVCIEIAVYKATVISLGDLEPGTYEIRAATGDAPPVTVTVP